MEFKDYYATLGVPKTASAKEIKQATQIINNLVDFSSSIEPMTAQVDLNSLIRMGLEAVREKMARAEQEAGLPPG